MKIAKLKFKRRLSKLKQLCHERARRLARRVQHVRAFHSRTWFASPLKLYRRGNAPETKRDESRRLTALSKARKV